MKIMIKALFLLLVLFSLSFQARSQPPSQSQPVDVDSRDNEKKYATEEEIKSLRKELLYIKELLHKLHEDRDKLDERIDSKIESETASHFVNSFTALIKSGVAFIALVIALFSIIGLPTLRVFTKRHIKKVHKEYEAESGPRISNKIYLHLSHAFYLYYRDFYDNPDHGAFKSGVSLATWFADGAIANAEKLPKGEEKNDKLKFAVLHRAYHYASISLSLKQEAIAKTSNQEIALKIARENNDFADKTFNSKLSQWINCKDTIAWVYILLGNNDEKFEGKRIVEALLEHEDISQYDLKQIKENYLRIKDLPRFEDAPYFPTIEGDDLPPCFLSIE